MVTPRLRWLLLGLIGLWLAGCSATPITIPGGPDGGVSMRDSSGPMDAMGARDGAVMPDAGVIPSTDGSSSADAGATDMLTTDAEAGVSDAEAGTPDAEAGAGDALAADGDVDDAAVSLMDAEPDGVSSDGN